MRSFSVRLFLVCAIVTALPLISAAAVTPVMACPPGTERITPTTRELATSAGIPESAECWSPNNQYAGAKAGAAKQYLMSVLRGGSCGPYRTTAENLDPKFAICAARFIKDLRARDPSFSIVSMFRSEPHQVYLCAGGCGVVYGPCGSPKSSNHPKGIAIDISNGQKIVPQWVQQMGRGYGIEFPIRNDSGHMQPIAGSDCADPGFVPSDTGGPVTSALSNRIRQALGIQQQPPPPAPAPVAQPIAPAQQQPLQSAFDDAASICTPSFSCTNNTMYYKNTSCTQQVYQLCSKGCDGDKCAGMTAAPTTTTPVASTTNTNTNTNRNTDVPQSTSTLDLINAFADLAKPVEVGTTSKTIQFRLNPETGDIEQIDTRLPTTLAPASSTISSIQSVNAPQTFTSGNLSGSITAAYTPQQLSGFQNVLANMRTALEKIIQTLKPFGRSGQAYTTVSE